VISKYSYSFRRVNKLHSLQTTTPVPIGYSSSLLQCFLAIERWYRS